MTKGMERPAFGRRQLETGLSVEGSTWTTRPPLVPTQSEPAGAMSSIGVPPTEKFETNRLRRTSSLEIVPTPSLELITQTQSFDAAIADGAFPTGTAATTFPEAGSIAAIEFG